MVARRTPPARTRGALMIGRARIPEIPDEPIFLAVEVQVLRFAQDDKGCSPFAVLL
jgi:hypothetical protein